MIYVSSSCIRYKKIKDSVKELAENGFQNIELSGGTQHYNNIESDLLKLKEKYNLNYRCHNYFPPPKNDFVLNLASLNDEIYEKTFSHLLKSIELSKKLDAKKFGFHAGFFIDVSLNEIGKKIAKKTVFDKEKAIARFCNGYEELKKNSYGINLYIENNVFSSSNYKTYEGENLFMMTTHKEYLELTKKIDFNLLLDVAHLKVSANSLRLDFDNEFTAMIKQSDYIHISDNDGLHDLNNTLEKNSCLAKALKKQNLISKDLTLEIYGNLEESKKTYNILKEFEYE